MPSKHFMYNTIQNGKIKNYEEGDKSVGQVEKK